MSDDETTPVRGTAAEAEPARDKAPPELGKEGAAERSEPSIDEATHEAPREPGPGPEGMSGRMRRALASGLRTVLSAEEALREGFPREVLHYAMRQIDLARDEAVRVTGDQVRRFLTEIDVAGEVRRILTSVSFEVRTTVRFVSNEDGRGVRLERTQVRVSRGPEGETSGTDAGGPGHDVFYRRGRLTRAVEAAVGAFSRELMGEADPSPDAPDAAPDPDHDGPEGEDGRPPEPDATARPERRSPSRRRR
jgi:hypothetical protein